MPVGKNKRQAFLPLRAPRPERHYARDSASEMQQRQIAAQDEAIRRLRLARKISSAIGAASGTGSGT
jgi:hypothetical protein